MLLTVRKSETVPIGIGVTPIMAAINMNKHIWEGWTVGDFIEVLAPQVEIIMSGRSWRRPFKVKKELAEWCKDKQPYYKKRIADVNNYFAGIYRLK